jgi:hypothetical protein
MIATTQRFSSKVSLRGVSRLAIIFFIICCIFDPADKILGAKVWAFGVCWMLAVATAMKMQQRVTLPYQAVFLVYIFILIPTLSVLGYLARSGDEPYYGLDYLKGYILITFTLLLVIVRISILHSLAVTLTCLSMVIITTYLIIENNPELYPAIYIFGDATGLIQLDSARDYGNDVVLSQIYFVTSPMIVMAIAYWFHRAYWQLEVTKRLQYGILVAINVFAMLVAGSRNNIVMALVLPTLLVFQLTRKKTHAMATIAVSIVIVSIVFQTELQAFFDPGETSNSNKLVLIDGYNQLFQDIRVLLIGQGLGSFHAFDGRGVLSVTELTYHEMIRHFGLLGALIILFILLFPVWVGFFKAKNPEYKCLVVAYVCYLVMSVSNPLLFSSMGVLLLSAMLCEIYLKQSIK